MSAPSDRGILGHARPVSIRLVLGTVALDALGFGIVIPIVPSLVMQLEHGSAAQTSLWMGGLLAAFSVMQFLCAPLLGGLSDRFGRRPVLLVALAGMALNYLLLAWAPSVLWLFAGRIVAGATAASYSTATAYIADVTPPGKRAQRFGLVGAMFGLGFVVGPALGGVLGTYGLRLPFLLAAILAGINFILAAILLPESLKFASRRPMSWVTSNPIGSLRVLSADANYRRLAIAWCSTWFALGVLQSAFVLANNLRLGFAELQNGLALTVLGVGSALVQGLLVRRIVPVLGERRAALIGFSLTACAYVSFTVAGSVPVLLLGIVLQSLGAINGPAIQSLLSVKAGADEQGRLQGALASLQGLTAIVAPLVGSWIFSVFANPAAAIYFPGAPFLLGTMACLTAVGAIAAIREPVRRLA
ncbi:MAG: TCR/Tet family MFS transporter [Pseudomonadota bacterium]|nr:TCR/Tet family MFS transporter [Pseudomonadota bacterium]